MIRPTLTAATLLALAPLAAQTPITINGPKATLKAGLLLQGGYEAASHPALGNRSQTFFLRRARILLSGTLGDDFEYFLETDNPNLGKADLTTGAKNNGGFMIQDAILTWKALPNLKVDMGLILAPLSHHSSQGATNLLTWDYSAYAFLQNGATAMGTSTGRDTGLQFRGTLGGTWVEYRVGVFQGKRLPAVPATPGNPGAVGSRNALRLAGHAQVNFFDVENGLFLGGTYLGAKKIVSVGLGHDRQDDYKATSVDALVDLPLGENGFTFQADLVSWDGKTWLPTVPKQRTLFTEASYRFGALKLAPMLRYETQRMDQPTATTPDETRTSLGLAWWVMGHNVNLKAFATRVNRDAPGVTFKRYTQANVQLQFLAF